MVSIAPVHRSIALDPEYKTSNSQLSSFIALNFHTQSEQKQIVDAALNRGMTEHDKSFSNVILMITLSSVDVITFGKEKGEGNNEQTSSVKVAGRRAFDAGTAYADIRCKEDHGPLGQADFSAACKDAS